MKRARSRLLAALALAALPAALVTFSSAALAATVTVDFFNGADGFHSALPPDPASTAPGATLGEQRRASFEAAAADWGSRLISGVAIVVEADMVPLSCNSSSAILGAAGTISVEKDWTPGPGGMPAPFVDTWYHAALANKLANFDHEPADGDVGATFNSDLDDNNSCLGGINWFYATMPGPAPPGTIAFYDTVLHEIGHGIGVSSLVSTFTGQAFAGSIDVYSRFLADNSSGLTWDQMSNAERLGSMTDTGDLVWSGAAVTEAAPATLTDGLTAGRVRMYAPSPLRPGSSISHFDTVVAAGTTNELMEPFATSDQAILVTDELLLDIGWGSLCGNGVLDGGEACDDGNNAAGDGCSVLCVLESCHSCDAAEPTTCTPETGSACDDGISCTTEICNAGACDADFAGCSLDLFKLYKVKPGKGTAKFGSREVPLTDAFETRQTVVLKPAQLANPADAGGGVSIPEGHLVCYKTKDAKTAPAQAKFVKRDIQTTNQFGTENLVAVKPTSLCVPSSQAAGTAPPALPDGLVDHYKCYKVKASKGAAKFVSQTLTLTDSFETKETLVLKPAEVCNPVDKDGEGILDPTGHLECYKIKDAKTSPAQAKFGGTSVFTRNQFGNLALDAKKPARLCVPATRQDL